MPRHNLHLQGIIPVELLPWYICIPSQKVKIRSYFFLYKFSNYSSLWRMKNLFIAIYDDGMISLHILSYTRLNYTHMMMMMEKCQNLTPINTIRHITINCEQFSWNVNCCLRQRKTSYNMICGHVNTQECWIKRRKFNIVVEARWSSTNQRRIYKDDSLILFKNWFCK